MKMDMLALAAELGFAKAALIDTAKVVFRPEFRPYCEANLCGKYGANYTCPPDSGTVEEMSRRVTGYGRALVLQTVWEVEDPMDKRVTKPAKAFHNRRTRQLMDRVGKPGLMVGASGCDLCAPCAITRGEPCVFPELRFSCMSAYCVFVKDLAQRCGMEYDCGPGRVAFFSMYCFDEAAEDR